MDLKGETLSTTGFLDRSFEAKHCPIKVLGPRGNVEAEILRWHLAELHEL